MSDHSSLRDAQLAAARLWAHDQIREDMRWERDEAIRSAHADGATIAELARATELTRTMLYKIINKESPDA